ncbi:ras-like GTP-binding protein RHO [Gigantopelta aegis]|uniref:ras-like GTP-binding protein RHO n=1 Tax=Gigantopelta aegis TaxID=1735272 RepID=UPI001B88CB5E|nr:ras-like GTP-binding protein RHO [Gigantopelta aegis]
MRHKIEGRRKKVAMIGDRASGQSGLLAAFSNIVWPAVYVPSVFSSFDVSLKDYNTQMEFAVWGTSGLETCHLLRRLFYHGANIIVVCYSIDNPRSLDNIPRKWLPEVNKVCPDVPLILVGNNKHARHDDVITQAMAKCHMSPVSYDDGLQMSKFIGAVTYLECSAKTGEGICDVFETAKQSALKE